MDLLLAEPLPFDTNQVTPGVIGFAVTALVAIAVMLLLWDFNRRVRRINDRADVKERIEAELAAQRQEAPSAADPAADADVQRTADPAGSSDGAAPRPSA
jgi:hypothetical protein